LLVDNYATPACESLSFRTICNSFVHATLTQPIELRMLAKTNLSYFIDAFCAADKRPFIFGVYISTMKVKKQTTLFVH